MEVTACSNSVPIKSFIPLYELVCTLLGVDRCQLDFTTYTDTASVKINKPLQVKLSAFGIKSIKWVIALLSFIVILSGFPCFDKADQVFDNEHEQKILHLELFIAFRQNDLAHLIGRIHISTEV